MIIKYDEENKAAEIEFDDDIMLWAEKGKIYIHKIICKKRPVVIDENLYTEVD